MTDFWEDLITYFSLLFVQLMGYTSYLSAKLALIEKIILALQHEGRAIIHQPVIQSYNTDEKLLYVNFCRQELEESINTISEKHYKTTKYQIDELAGYRPDLTLQQLNFEFLQKYYLFEKGNKLNTLHGDFKMIRKFLNLAIKKGLTKIIPSKILKYLQKIQ